jgi:uncharacterized protein YdaU (DUF1376 family)
VNSYSHDIEAYQKKTAHLSMAEHGAYLQMLQVYYVTEKPLPTGKALYRVVRADTKAERAAVDLVVKEFWHESAGGLVNARADKVIAEYHSFIGRQSDKGKASAAKRRLNHGTNSGSTTVQPRLKSGTNRSPTGHPTGIQPTHGRESNGRQIPDPDSEDQGSSAAMQPSDPSGLDPRKAIFDLGKRVLGASAGGLISAAITRKGEERVAEIIAGMAIKSHADPKAYFQAATRVGHDRVVV